MSLYPQHYILNRNDTQIITENRHGWYNKKEFGKILKQERHRSKLNNLPISFILIDLAKCRPNTSNISVKMYNHFLKILLTLITDYTRDYDIKHYCNLYKIKILLLDTSQSDAQLYINKIIKKLSGFVRSSGKNDFTQMIQMLRISSYTLNEIAESIAAKCSKENINTNNC